MPCLVRFVLRSEDLLGTQHINLNTASQRPLAEVFERRRSGSWRRGLQRSLQKRRQRRWRLGARLRGRDERGSSFLRRDLKRVRPEGSVGRETFRGAAAHSFRMARSQPPEGSPQLTARAVVAGLLLGAVLALSNV